MLRFRQRAAQLLTCAAEKVWDSSQSQRIIVTDDDHNVVAQWDIAASRHGHGIVAARGGGFNEYRIHILAAPRNLGNDIQAWKPLPLNSSGLS